MLWSVDESIEKAMREGKFDNLPGQGEPFKWDEMEELNPSVRLVNSLLKNNGFAPEPIERRRAIQTATLEARRALERTWRVVARARTLGHSDPRIEARWERAVADFHDQIAAINRAIRDLELVAQTPALTLPHLDAQAILRETMGG